MTNQPQIISKELFCNNRFALTEFATRFGDVEWFLADAESIDEFGLPAVVYQGSKEGAMQIIASEDATIEAAWSDEWTGETARQRVGGTFGS